MTDMQEQGTEHSMIRTFICEEVTAYSACQAGTDWALPDWQEHDFTAPLSQHAAADKLFHNLAGATIDTLHPRVHVGA